MNKTLKAALAVFAAAGIAAATHTPAANAQAMGSPETTVGGETVYVESGRDAGYTPQGHNGLNINGAVGLTLNPTAIIPNQGSVRVQANYYDGPSLRGPGLDIDTKYYGIFAAGRVGEMPLEISGGLAKFDTSVDSNSGIPAFDSLRESTLEDAFDKSGLVLGAKYQLRGLADDPNGVRLAVGATYNRALLRNTNLYFVASKAFGVGQRAVTGHLGVRYDRFRLSLSSSSKFSVYAGAEVPIDKEGRFAVVGEVGTKIANSDLLASTPYSLALRYQNGNGLGISGGIQRIGVLSSGGSVIADDLSSSSSRLFISAGKTF